MGYWRLAIGYWRWNALRLLDSRPQNAVQNYYIFLTVKNNFNKKIIIDNFSKSVSITNSPASTLYTLRSTLHSRLLSCSAGSPKTLVALWGALCASLRKILPAFTLYTLHPTLPLGCLVHGGAPPCLPLLFPFVLYSRLPREFFYVYCPRGPR